MSSNPLCLNPSNSTSKTEFIVIGLPAQIKKIPILLSNNTSFTTFISDAPVRILLLILISLSPTTSTASRACFMHICDLHHIGPMLDFKAASTIATSIDHPPVSPFLDPLSLPISRSSTEPYPSLHHIFKMTFHLNSTCFL